MQEGDGETRGHGDGWLLGRNHLCMPYFTPGHVVRGGGRRRRRQPPAALHARRPGCQEPSTGGEAATFPAPLTLSGQQAPVRAAPASGPLRPAPLSHSGCLSSLRAAGRRRTCPRAASRPGEGGAEPRGRWHSVRPCSRGALRASSCRSVPRLPRVGGMWRSVCAYV